VGGSATAGANTVLSTPANVSVSAKSSQLEQEIAQSAVSKPNKEKGTALAVAIDLGIFTNDDEATIKGNTVVDAGGTISVTTSNDYPYLTDPSKFFTGIPQDIINRGMSAITDLMDGTLGVSSKLLNSWAIAGAKASESKAPAIALSIAVNVYNNTSNAIIES